MLAFDAVRSIVAPYVLGHPFPSRIDWLRDYIPFFALGILLYHRYATRKAGAAWIAAMIGAFVLASMRSAQLLDRMNDLTLHIGATAFWQGPLIASTIVLLMAASMHQVRSPALASLFRAAGRASYPLYVVHQLCGYWILNFWSARLHEHHDLRPVVVIAMVALSLYFGNGIEPRLIALYKRLLNDARRLMGTLMKSALGLRIQPSQPTGTGRSQLS
jgi:peptidoglycan/LPS O-acetylase OafA/YrhL